jgi:myo-inositol-1-phosphate synthase
LNFGGNTDFLTMPERERLESMKILQINAVTSELDYELSDRKWRHIRMEGRTFGDVPLNLECTLEVWDSPNSAGVMIDAARCCTLALDRGISGTLIGPPAYFMKSPPIQYSNDEARRMTENCIAGVGDA